MLNEKPVFYLKVNAESDYSIFCIQHWVNIAILFNAKMIFVCDKSSLKKTILEKIDFKSNKYEFIQSEKKKLKS